MHKGNGSEKKQTRVVFLTMITYILRFYILFFNFTINKSATFKKTKRVYFYNECIVQYAFSICDPFEA